MASESDHIACANRTQRTIAHLLSDPAVHSPWIATAAFYKALHIVEAVFANDKSVGHSCDHLDREQKLKRERKYANICLHYLPLGRAATNARYLLSCNCFDEYLPPEQVIVRLLKHHLKQLEHSARKFLSPAASAELVGIETAFSVKESQ
jgi:hypothetical protein